MSDPLTASDFWPLILHDERVRLAKLALRAAARNDSLPAELGDMPRAGACLDGYVDWRPHPDPFRGKGDR
jgi:hypothetical protein